MSGFKYTRYTVRWLVHQDALRNVCWCTATDACVCPVGKTLKTVSKKNPTLRLLSVQPVGIGVFQSCKEVPEAGHFILKRLG